MRTGQVCASHSCRAPSHAGQDRARGGSPGAAEPLTSNFFTFESTESTRGRRHGRTIGSGNRTAYGTCHHADETGRLDPAACRRRGGSKQFVPLEVSSESLRQQQHFLSSDRTGCFVYV